MHYLLRRTTASCGEESPDQWVTRYRKFSLFTIVVKRIVDDQLCSCCCCFARCANCNGKPATSTTTTTSNVNVANARHYPHYHYQSGGGSGGGGGSGASISNLFTGRSSHVLRLWAEVFHVSASSGAVRWTQVSDDLVPVSVSFVNNKFHVTAFNSRVEKVLDTWLTATRLGQASNCFVYWKDNVSRKAPFLDYLRFSLFFHKSI